MIGRRGLPWLALPAAAAESPRILSGGALEPPLLAALARYHATGGPAVAPGFATAPRIAARIASGWAGETPPDLVLAPPDVILALERAGALARPPVTLGAISLGIALRDGAPEPGMTDEASLRAALLAADALIYNRASTGLYMERLIERLGLTAPLAARTIRFPDGDAALRRIAQGSGREIGFAASSEILLFRDRGVRLLGPLPPGLGHSTTYAAALLRHAGAPAAALFDFLAGPVALAAMRQAGLE